MHTQAGIFSSCRFQLTSVELCEKETAEKQKGMLLK